MRQMHAQIPRRQGPRRIQEYRVHKNGKPTFFLFVFVDKTHLTDANIHPY